MRPEPVPDLPGLRVVRVSQQPLLGSSSQTGLELVPLPKGRGLDPERAETRPDCCVDDIGEIQAGAERRSWPHSRQLLLGRCPVPDLGTEQHPSAGVHQPAQRLERFGDAAKGLVGPAADNGICLAGVVSRLSLNEDRPVGKPPLDAYELAASAWCRSVASSPVLILPTTMPTTCPVLSMTTVVGA
jgi:hypothetical protein